MSEKRGKKVRKKTNKKSARKIRFSLSVKEKQKNARKKLSERRQKKSDYMVKEHRIYVQL